MDAHPYGWLSLLPSLVAIVLAIATRRVVISMLFGLFVGAIITCGGNLFAAVNDLLQIHLWESLVEEDRLRVFAFTLLMGAMVGVIERSGGMTGLVNTVSRWAHNRQRGQLSAWLLGMLVFFDDYANTVLLGNTLQPLCERLKISKEKLAYLVDSTAAPIAGLAIVSTWVAAEIDFVQSGLDSLATESEDGVTAFGLFIKSIPYRFYVLWSLVFVFFVGWLQRDFGPMLKAERRVLHNSMPIDDEADNKQVQIQASGWWNAVVPIVATVLAVIWLLWKSGLADNPDVASEQTLWQVFGNADSYSALLGGSLTGLVTAIVLVVVQRLLSWQHIEDAMSYGAKLMVPALAVLWLASALSAMTGHDPVPNRVPVDEAADYAVRDYRLYTGEYLANMIGDNEGEQGGTSNLARWMPTLIFVLSAGISFSTGTSWGTMAIVMPVAIPLVFGAMAGHTDGAWQDHPIVLGTIGSVLAGSIFGDHCSPISDTTVLSSQSCGCEHSAHVWTQLPYALTVGGVSIVFGTLPIGFMDIHVYWLMPAGVLGMFAILYLLGSSTADGS